MLLLQYIDAAASWCFTGLDSGGNSLSVAGLCVNGCSVCTEPVRAAALGFGS